MGHATIAGQRGAVSVVIPAYNGAAFIAEALRSVAAQSRPPDEIVVVDDGSADQTAALVVQISRDSSIPIHLISLPRNSGGPAKPLNAGIAAARGEYIALLEQDDRMPSQRIERCLEAAAAEPSWSLIVGRVAFFGDPPPAWQDPSTQFQYLAPLNSGHQGVHPVNPIEAIRSLLYRNFVVSNSNAFFRKQLWERIGGFDCRYRVCADFAFNLQAAAIAPIVVLAATLCEYRCRGDSLYRSENKRAFLEARELRLGAAVRCLPETLPEFWKLYWETRRLTSARFKARDLRFALALCRLLVRSGALRAHLRFRTPHAAPVA